jgi:hypothetical protein
MIITICASVDFTPTIIKVKKELEKRGWTVNIPFFTEKIIKGDLSFEEFLEIKNNKGDIELREAEATDMIKRYWDFIKASDAILVINMEKKGIINYIGGSVLMEMGFAYGHGKKIYLYNSIPEKSERIHYLDEIMDMHPIVINGDLSKIE